MMDFFSLLGIGVSAFVATNIDDIFLLMLFFSSPKFQKTQVVIGQYLGIGLLVIIGALGSLLALVIPQYVIGLLGLVPIVIGVIRIMRIRKPESSIQEQMNEQVNYGWHTHLSTLAIAAITFSNGGDNIGIYTPLFAKYSSAGEVVFLSIIFMVMTAVWCIIAYNLVSHPVYARRIHKVEYIIFPFVLIGLGIFIITSSFSQLI